MKIRFTFMGRGYDASTALPDLLELPEPATVDTALAVVAEHMSGPQALSQSCLVVLSGRHLGTVARHDNPVIAATDELVLIAPVAGG